MKHLVALFSAVALIAAASLQAEKPVNVVVVMADDIGFECYSCYGSEFYETPRIDALAKEGARFTQAYSQPICTPSRVKIMTGRYNFRNYKRFGFLDTNEPTFAKMVKAKGYRTAVAGKWQLTPGDLEGPTKAGFDEYCLWHFAGYGVDAKGLSKEFKDKGGRFKSPKLYLDGKLVPDTEGKYGPELVTDFLCGFIERNKDKPFVAYYPMINVHSPFVPTPDSPDWEKTDKKRDKLEHFRDMVAYMDKCVGRLVDQLEASGLRENTLVIVTGDNGTHTALTSPFPGRGEIKGGKGDMTDAGNRVAFVASWPGVIEPGTVVDSPIGFADVLTTIAEVTGSEAPEGSDGQSMVPLLKGDESKARGWVFQSYNRGEGPLRAFVRDAQWKLYADGSLYRVPEDWLEKSPVKADAGEALAAKKRLSEILEGIVKDAPEGRINRGK